MKEEKRDRWYEGRYQGREINNMLRKSWRQWQPLGGTGHPFLNTVVNCGLEVLDLVADVK